MERLTRTETNEAIKLMDDIQQAGFIERECQEFIARLSDLQTFCNVPELASEKITVAQLALCDAIEELGK